MQDAAETHQLQKMTDEKKLKFVFFVTALLCNNNVTLLVVCLNCETYYTNCTNS